MKNLLALCLLLIVSISGCVSGTFEEDSFCSTKEYPSVPVVPFSGVATLSYNYTGDFSSTISKVRDFGSVQVNLTGASLTSKENVPLDFIKTLTLSLVNDDGSSELLGTTSGSQSDTLNFSLNTSDTVIKALENGPIVLNITGTGSAPTQVITPVFTICASAKAKVRATLSDTL